MKQQQNHNKQKTASRQDQHQHHYGHNLTVLANNILDNVYRFTVSIADKTVTDLHVYAH